jgi:plasmid stabilization system protein ParE
VITFSDGALADLERVFEFNAERDPVCALKHIDTIRSAISVLSAHPNIGRRAAARSTLRELVISRGATGYIAIYEHFPMDDRIVVCAVRHQREAGYQTD